MAPNFDLISSSDGWRIWFSIYFLIYIADKFPKNMVGVAACLDQTISSSEIYTL